MRRTQVQAQIDADEEEKNSLQKEIERLQAKLVKVNHRLSKRINARNDCNKLIAETETAYIKVKCKLLNLTPIKIFVIKFSDC